jgi:two-component system cell cycle sensor histidine kinase/response regulator CckA
MQDQGTSRTILVVDDEPEVRKLVAAIVTSLGFSVYTADSGDHALALHEKLGGQVDLLITDVVARGMSGPVLAERLTRRQPGLKVLYISGYDHSHVVQKYVLDRGYTLLPKPFTVADVADMVYRLLPRQTHLGAAG